MKVTLTITSLLSILFTTFHLTDDIVRGKILSPPCGAHPGRVAVRNACARRAAIGVRHHPRVVAPRVGPPRHPHEGVGRRDRRHQVRRSLLLRLDTHRARRDRDLLRHPLGARTLEPATGPADDSSDLATVSVSMLLPIHLAAGELALLLGAVALSVKKGGTFHAPRARGEDSSRAVHDSADARAADPAAVRRDVLLAVEGPRPPYVAGARPIRCRRTGVTGLEK